ncbi:MAG: glycosyltransferase, partial [Candidatus Omnitrophica bacterium]|nr:glycosyltransferase [Candidatus Omnitrophota bacterium]
IFRRKALLEAGGFTVRSMVGGEDTDIGYKLKEAGYRIVYEPRMVVYHDPEDSMKIYLKRNYRNAKAYIWVFYNRSKKEAMTDDFFPWILLAQPFLTILWFLSIVLIPLNVCFVPVLIFVSLLIFGSFVPVIKEVINLRGKKAILPAAAQLFLRNITWCCGLIIGVLNLIRVNTLRQKKSLKEDTA